MCLHTGASAEAGRGAGGRGGAAGGALGEAQAEVGPERVLFRCSEAHLHFQWTS